MPQVLFVRRPAFLRAESLGPLGTPQFYMVTDGREMRVFNPAENRYYWGAADFARLFPFLSIPLPMEEIAAFLLGGLPADDCRSVSIRGDREEGLWQLDLICPGGERRRLRVDPRTSRLRQVEIIRLEAALTLRFTEFRNIRGTLFPGKIHLALHNSETELTIDYQDIELNPPWEPQDFELPVPRGATVLPLE